MTHLGAILEPSCGHLEAIISHLETSWTQDAVKSQKMYATRAARQDDQPGPCVCMCAFAGFFKVFQTHACSPSLCVLYSGCAYACAFPEVFNDFAKKKRAARGPSTRVSMRKFALHDVKLLRQNGQWGGERGRGDLMYI